MTLEHLARTIAKARYGTDTHWAAMMPAAKAVVAEVAAFIEADIGEPLSLTHRTHLSRHDLAGKLRALAKPNSAQDVRSHDE